MDYWMYAGHKEGGEQLNPASITQAYRDVNSVKIINKTLRPPAITNEVIQSFQYPHLPVPFQSINQEQMFLEVGLCRHVFFRSESCKLYGMRNRVLIVDDETDIKAILCDRLQAIGFDALTAANGLEAIEILKRAQIDAILLDLVMPHMDGLTLLQRLRDEHILVPVIMVSASSNQAVLEQATQEGATAYILKPINFGELELKLRSLLSSSG